jgi:hypothetical protein
MMCETDGGGAVGGGSTGRTAVDTLDDNKLEELLGAGGGWEIFGLGAKKLVMEFVPAAARTFR